MKVLASSNRTTMRPGLRELLAAGCCQPRWLKVLVLFGPLLIISGCVAPARSIVHGDAYAYVMTTLEAPAQTRVFVAGQYSPSELPASVWIGNVGFASTTPSRRAVEQARLEGARLKADYVVVYTSGSGAAMVMGMSAFRVMPVNLGYIQKEGVIAELTSPEALRAGLQVGDRVLTIDGLPFSARIRKAFASAPGEAMTIVVQRGGAQHSLQIIALPNPPQHLALPEAHSL